MTVQTEIEQKIRKSLSPVHLEVINESHMHNVPPGSESHFKVVVISPEFETMSRIQRHQTVNRLLVKELNGSVHALSMATHTATEWAKSGGQILGSPLCKGGKNTSPE